MLGNERERTYAMIRLIGSEPGVEAIRIYNKQGEIKFSNSEEEIGTAVDLQAEACYACHASAEPLEALPSAERARIYRKEGAYRVLGTINPIRNEESCWNAACHAHSPEQSILGVLDVQMSMEQLDRIVGERQWQALGLAVVILSLSMLLTAAIVYRAVHLPARQLRRGTDELARGNLDVAIDLERSDELGDLAKSFNRMAASLREADAELRSWSQTLEDRVRQKTEELEQMNQQMIRVERTASLGRMAATVAHELNNPLSGILTYAKLITKRVERSLPEGPDREKVLDNLDLIRSESVRCGNIVRDLLTFARGRSAEFAPAHLHELVEQTLKLISHHGKLKQIHTEVELTLENDEIICDREQIVQALLALLINAVEAMHDGGRLVVRTAAAGEPADLVHLSVRDDGVGIPPEVREHMFDPFFSTKNEAKGVGLGLAVVYGIVRRHEGNVSVESRPGEGATFTLELPRDPASIARARSHKNREHGSDV
jgi:two-component system NtrC family sensor kinase